MFYLNPIVWVIIIIGIAVLFFVLIFLTRKGGSSEKKEKKKDRNAIIKEANRKLAQNPKDAEALLALGNLYYSEEEYDKSLKTFGVLLELCATNPDLDDFLITKMYGLSAMKAKKLDEAYKNLVLAWTARKDDFEVNNALGHLEYLRKNYEKAELLLQRAVASNPDHYNSLRYHGLSLYRLKRHSEALEDLKKALDVAPEDKEALFAAAHSYHETGQSEQALRIFTHLRTDPTMGPMAALYAGTIHINTKQYQDAILDLEIGLRHENIKPENLLEMKYRLAAAYVKENDLAQAVQHLTEIKQADPDYKDVHDLLNSYSELNSNKNLQVFLMSASSEFISLCRRITETYIPRSATKIVDIALHKSDHADILAEVSTSKWEDLILFRFIRTAGHTGELVVRDLYSHMKELRAGRGFCITAGDFSDGARQFVEARLIDLVGKDQLMKCLKKLN